MIAFADLINQETLKKLAVPSNLRQGKELAESGKVELVEFTPLRIVAKVGGGNRRTVTLEVSANRLAWTCTCGKKKNFCKHCVAVTLVIQQKTSRK